MPNSSRSSGQDETTARRLNSSRNAPNDRDENQSPIPTASQASSPRFPPLETDISDTVVYPDRVNDEIRDPEKAIEAIRTNRAARPRPAMQRQATTMDRVRVMFVAPVIGPVPPAPTYRESFMAALKYTPLNVCLLFIPVSWALHFTHQSATLIFVFSCIGMIPLAALLGLGTEQIALRTSASVGGLLNMSLGNLIEMIISGIALRKCQLELIQSSLIGGLLSNLLLVLGTAFFVGGFRFESQEFHPRIAQLNSSLMVVAVISLIIPVAFNELIGDRLRPGSELAILLQLSRGSAVILMVIYLAYLYFQFYSHNHLFLDVMSNTSYSSSSSGSTRSSHFNARSMLSRLRGRQSHSSAHSLPLSQTGRRTRSRSPSPSSASSASSIEVARMNTYSAIGLLVVVTVFAYVTAEHLVESLTEFTEQNPSVSREWITLIVIPVISNAAEHTTAVIVASKGKFDLALTVAVGSCIQISLFVIPILIFVAWGMGKPLTLLFDQLETLVLFLSVILVKFSVEDGKSHWMSGAVLVCVYVLIALSFWNFPDTVRLVQGQPIVCV